MHKTLIKALAGLSAALACATAQATQSGADTIGAGAEGFLAGTLPPAGWYGVFYYTHYQADRFNDDAGRSAAPGFKLSADVLVPRLLYMSDRTLWGGRLGGFALAPLPRMSLDAGGAHESRGGLGDAAAWATRCWGRCWPGATPGRCTRRWRPTSCCPPATTTAIGC
ncbi:transporter [Chromobacterium sp. Panama]|uniref:transporter n=1 Tax=Chromobacterium sp. Panama TaxID=2161826 RepID=UPI0018EE8681|nr:transporter [Chromobacterium sp. Panama]